MSKQTGTEPLLLDITGMTCAACSARIEKVVGKLEGVQEIGVNFALQRARVVYDESRIGPEQIENKIRGLGFGVLQKKLAEMSAEAAYTEAADELKKRALLGALLTLPFLWAMMAHHELTRAVWVPELLLSPWLQWAIATYAQFVIGYPFYFRAYQALRSGVPNMDVLVVLGTTAAYLYSHYLIFHPAGAAAMGHHAGMLYFDTGVMIFTIVLFGKWLEAKAKRQTMGSIRQLSGLQAGTANVVQDGRETVVPVGQVRPGDMVIVRPGDIIPVDGIVAEGSATVDESAVTGESLPVDKHEGGMVVSGTINTDGYLRIRATRSGSDTTASSMLRLLEEAQVAKPPIQRLADRLSGVFVPVIIVVAAAAFLASYYVMAPGETGLALATAVAVLMIACPCALGLATPISVLVGSGRAALAGIWFKQGAHLESLSRVDTVLLDKTGTLSEGKPAIVAIEAPAGRGDGENELLRQLAAAEQHSEHPFAKEIVQEAQRRGLPLPACESFEAVPGCGLRAIVEGREVLAGSVKWFRQLGFRISLQDQLGHIAQQGKSALCVAVGGKWAGTVIFADKLKPTSRNAVRRLRELGLRVVMVTGDRTAAAVAAAGQAGIQETYAEMLPEHKLELVQRLQKEGRKVLMVGDGINDAPAMASADVGAALGSGTDITKASADLYLLKNDLNGIAEAIRLSRLTLRNVRQNLALSLVYNAVAIPFAITGNLAPWMACTAMALSSLTVIGNALRLRNA
ncbi:heavy metal translocating P-type ATPase [Paenibacillus thalictri]|nr:heavy metal translocating P-type ATPase [Paenibacillus thalictri]